MNQSFDMKNVTPIILLIVCGTQLAGAAAQSAVTLPPETLVRWHYLGKSISATPTNGATAQTIAALPATRDLLRMALDKLARLPIQLWPEHLPRDASNQIPLLRPLLSDLLTAESCSEIRSTGPQCEWIVAARLNPDQTRRCHTNLWQLFSLWMGTSPEPQTEETPSAWKATHPKQIFQAWLTSSKGWTVLSVASSSPVLHATWVQQIQKSGHPWPSPPKTWLDLKLNGPRLLSKANRLKLKHPPLIHLTVNGEGEYIRTHGRLLFDQPLNLTLDPWLIPTNLINDPLISFVAARGIRPLLQGNAFETELGLTNPPNQLFLWGQPAFGGQTLVATPTAKPTNTILTLAPRLPPLLHKIFGQVTGQINWVSNRAEIFWGGLPIITPFIKPTICGGRPYLLAGMIPSIGRTNPPPPELFSQLGQKENLVYYGWEITEQRLLHNRHYFQLGTILAKRQLIASSDASFVWLQEIHKHLGNTSTEITLTSPRELSLVRRSHLGLSGVELVLLARWLESPGFPLRFEVPPMQVRRPNPPASKPSPQ